ncbi:geranylgeranyl transferase type-2 subunit alpha [Bacillus rossius redtenbacheri]|uniref:geranylgeranyl transferase type-2 subunit alpha n=1 Tax=Bacillus rossius redtenbacheri TaxID=93214 RepID=UPI002FDCC9C4
MVVGVAAYQRRREGGGAVLQRGRCLPEKEGRRRSGPAERSLPTRGRKGEERSSREHGRVKTRSTEEQQAAKKKEREKKLKLYRAGIDTVFAKCRKEEYDEEALEVTAQLLSANPDIYTLWNVRKKVLLRFKETKAAAELQEQQGAELRLTELCLRGNPKSYGAWHHRVWVLDNLGTPDWGAELALCSKYLKLDERNFHCWDYRRHVVEKASTCPAEELAFSTAKINSNFSNYSAWHYRSRLLPLVHPDTEGGRPIESHKHGQELKLVESAAFTDPDDTSAWFYQRWLLGRAGQPLAVVQARVTLRAACLCLSRCVRLDGPERLRAELWLDGMPVPGTWASSSGLCFSHVWVLQPAGEVLRCGDSPPREAEVRLCRGSDVVQVLTLAPDDAGLAAARPLQFGAQFGLAVTSVLEEQLASCTQLLELEPDSKWTLLTSVLLMQAIDRNRYHEDTMKNLYLLLKVDPLRSGYYRDLRSRYEMEYALDAAAASGKSELRVSGSGLTALYHSHYLSTLRHVDLSGNHLHRSLPQLHSLQCCQVLVLDNNGIKSLEGMPSLRSLQELSLKDNGISDVMELKLAKTRCPCINTFSISGNPVEKESSLLEFASVAQVLIKPS